MSMVKLTVYEHDVRIWSGAVNLRLCPRDLPVAGTDMVIKVEAVGDLITEDILEVSAQARLDQEHRSTAGVLAQLLHMLTGFTISMDRHAQEVAVSTKASTEVAAVVAGELEWWKGRARMFEATNRRLEREKAELETRLAGHAADQGERRG